MYWNILSTLQITLCVFLVYTSGTWACTEPDEAHLEALHRQQIGGECDDFVLGLHHITPFRQIYENKGLIHEKTECPNSGNCGPSGYCCHGLENDDGAMCTTNAQSEDVKKRSICPYTFKRVNRSDLYPREMVEAVCACNFCQIPDGDEVAGAACEPVHYNIPVLKRTGNTEPTGTCEYVKAYHPIAVGCACAVAQTSTSE